MDTQIGRFLISSFRRVLYVVCFLLGNSTHIYLPMKMEQTECPETSAYKLQTPGNYPKESIQDREIFGIILSGRMREQFREHE